MPYYHCTVTRCGKSLRPLDKDQSVGKSWGCDNPSQNGKKFQFTGWYAGLCCKCARDDGWVGFDECACDLCKR